jgi:5-methylcytosine-specific restriction endonuclease McrA
MPFVQGYQQTDEHKERAKAARVSKNGMGSCEFCGKSIAIYSKNQKTCGAVECAKARERKKLDADPVAKKAFNLSGNVRLGTGKKEKMYALLQDALGGQCAYCPTTINLENASLDHKTPRTTSKVYDRKARKQVYTDAEIRVLDSIENLHIVCRDCNQTKSNLTDQEFRCLLGFLADQPEIKSKLFQRLKLTRTFFGFKRGH